MAHINKDMTSGQGHSGSSGNLAGKNVQEGVLVV